ncbi:hypothetical protein AGMMS49525_05420 [Bacteroidia bacterium]|nr:hypothetical protein AGMMS49525_05420 [Bacteroidia bacterium]
MTATGAQAQTWDCGSPNAAAVTATLNGGTLTVSGSGNMADYSSGTAPWYGSRTAIAAVIIDNGITSIGNYAFEDCPMTIVIIPNSVSAIGTEAFGYCTGLTSVYNYSTAPQDIATPNAFFNVTLGNVDLHVPSASVSAYRSVNVWKDFKPALAMTTSPIMYVTETGAGDFSGSSWTNAYPGLADPLLVADRQRKGTIATAPSDTIRQIWVAAGTYLPQNRAGDGATDRDRAFVLAPDVKIYGGFAGDETDIDQRPSPPTSQLTLRGSGGWLSILSGDFDNDSTLSNNDAYHVVISAGAVGTALLDGFTITGGNANGIGSITVNSQSIVQPYGGGMYNLNSSPALANITFSGNNADFGGGMFNESSSLVLTNITISGNSAISGGGGMHNDNSSPTLTNVTISANSGGGMSNNDSSPVLTNCILWGNTATSGGLNNVFNVNSSSPTFAYSLVEGSGGSSSWNTTDFGTDSGNNIDGDPLFENWIDPAQGGWTPTTAGDYRLQPGSPCINAGNNAANSTTTDPVGIPRISNSVIDMGAYENVLLVPNNGIVYVTTTGAGDFSGSSWANACQGLADPLLVADLQSKGTTLAVTIAPITQIWVAAGTYKPQYRAGDGATDRDRAFVLVPDVKIYGGFAGDESNINQRQSPPTPSGGVVGGLGLSTLSGDIGTTGINTDNAYHVVIGVNIPGGGNTLLDGFTITGGNANGGGNITVNSQTIYQNYGGGMFNDNSSPALTNVTISGNSTNYAGGGIVNVNSSSPELTNVIISENQAYDIAGGTTLGGGIVNANSSPVLTNVIISGNSANYLGGGIVNANYSSPELTNVIISGNSANISGGMYNDNSSPVLTNVTISGNSANSDDGGGMYNERSSSPALTNCILWGNTAGRNGNNLYNDGFGAPTYAYSLVGDEDLTGTGTGNLDGTLPASNPLFVNWIDPTQGGWTPTTAGDYRLLLNSPCVNTGSNAANSTLTDLAGIPRVSNSSIDMGAYEALLPTPDAAGIVYVTETGNGTGDGSSWNDAFADLATPLLAAQSNTAITQIWVAAGTYKPQYKAGNGATDRDRAFVLVPDVKIYGGFAGNETNINQRPSPPTLPTPQLPLRGLGGLSTLSGDLDNDSTLSSNDAYHVVIAAGAVGDALLDGFTITGGNANGSNTIIIVNSQSIVQPYGGGIFNQNSSPALTNVTVSGNNANSEGGGMCNISSSPVLTNVAIVGNSANINGGGMFNNDSSSPVLTNVTISGNSANINGGGMFNDLSSTPALTNCIVWGNTGSNVHNDNSTPTYAYSLIEGSGGSGSWNTVDFGTDNGNNIDGNPLFVAPEPAANTPTTVGDYRLRPDSPGINAGNNAANSTTTDPVGIPRISNSTIDMGAYETALPTPDAAGIVYVTETGNGTGDGSSWANAFADLATPLFTAQSNTAITQIWVAEGTYKPQYRAGNGTNDRTRAFVLVPDVKLYGGFAGNETDIDQRPSPPTSQLPLRGSGGWLSILSGDLDNDSTLSSNDAYHVVIAAGAVGTALLDGFSITGGNANGIGSISVNSQSIDQYGGGGMYNGSSSPTLTNLTISGNYAENAGGMFNDSSSPVLTDVAISANSAYYAGGMFNNNSSPVLTNIILSGNSADFAGGGMYNDDSSPALTNVIISGNSAYGGGGMVNNDFSSPVLTNVTISGNNANLNGGGMFNNDSSSPALINSIVWGNAAGSGDNNVFNINSSPTYAYSLVEGSGGSSSWNTTDFGTDNGNNIDDNPLFVAPESPSAVPTTAGDYRLQQGSPCVNAGNNAANSTATDLAGIPRINGVIDMGAYESLYKGTVQGATAVLADTEYGTALAPTLTGGTIPAGANTLYIYSASQNGTYAPTAPINVGTYWVKGVIEETPTTYADTTAAVSFRITPATLTITPSAGQSKIFGASDPTSYAYTASGWKYSDDVSLLTGALSRTAGEDVGTYAILQGTLAETGSNYTIDFTQGVMFEIEAATFALAAATVTISGTYTYNGFAQTPAAVDVTVAIGTNTMIYGTDYTFAASNNTNAGNAILILTGAGVYTGTVMKTFVILPKGVTINGLTASDRGYDGTTTAVISGTATLSDNYDGTNLSIVAGTAAFADKNVGNGKTVTFSDYALAGTRAGNYTLTAQPASVTANITPATLNITPDAGLYKVEGASDPTFTYTSDGWQTGDDESLFTGALDRTAGENVGTYAILQGTLAETSGNYTISFATDVMFEIEAATSALAAATVTISGTYTYNGSAQTPAAVDVTVAIDANTLIYGTDYTFAASNNTNAGNATLTVTGAGDYAGTVTKTFPIFPKDVTVSISANGKVYDGTTTASLSHITLNGTLVVDDLYPTGGIIQFDNSNAGANKTVIYSDYSLAGTSAGNYTLTNTAATADADITPEVLTISPEAGQNKVFGKADPVFTFEASGQITGELPAYSGALARVAGETVGQYDITQGNLALIDNGAFLANNYTLAFDASPVAFAIIPSSNTGVKSVTVNGSVMTGNFYVADCGATGAVISVTTEEPESQVMYKGVAGNTFTVDISRADIYDIEYTVVAETGDSENYRFKIERFFVFEEITGMKFNNVLYVNNNSDNNHGYHFTAYEWFKNGQSVGTGQYYSVGDNRTDLLDPTAKYSVTLTTDEGKVLHTCVGYVTLQAASLRVYPNPTTVSEKVTIEYNSLENPANESVKIYNASGGLVSTQTSAGSGSQIVLPSTAGTYVIQINNESVKVIVK